MQDYSLQVGLSAASVQGKLIIMLKGRNVTHGKFLYTNHHKTMEEKDD